MTEIVHSDPDAAFFAGARAGVFTIQQCNRCGHNQFALSGRTAAVRRCRRCTEPLPPWIPAQGTGTLVSYTVVHNRPVAPGGPPQTNVAGIIELSEGPWVCAAIDADPDFLRSGMELTASFDPSDDGAPPQPVFRP